MSLPELEQAPQEPDVQAPEHREVPAQPLVHPEPPERLMALPEPQPEAQDAALQAIEASLEIAK